MEPIQPRESFHMSEIIDSTEYERLRGIKESFINHKKNEDNLYGVYMPREQKVGDTWEFTPSKSGNIEFDLLPDVVCVNLSDISPIEWIEKFWKDITILDGWELRKWNIKVLAGKSLNEKYNGLKLLRMSVGTIDIVNSTNQKGETHIHIPTVHRGRTGYSQNWDQRTTTAWGALRSDLATDALREAVEESGILWINKDGEFELCLPAIEGVNSGTIEHWMSYAIDTFLSAWGKYDRFTGKYGWTQTEREAAEYAKKVFSRNFHWSTENFSPWVLKSILLSIKEWKRYSYRTSRTMTQADELIQDLWAENFRKVVVHEGNSSHGWDFWIDNDPAAFHVFRIETDITLPEWFQPIFRFYSESWVHYQRNPRIENLTGNTDTTGLNEPSSIDMKPVPFLQKFAKQVVEGRTKKRVNTITNDSN
jgi:hypothetical protein